MKFNFIPGFKTVFLAFFAFLFTFPAFSQTKEQLDALDKYYEKALSDWNIPGMAIAIVSGDEVVFAKGYGYANIENKNEAGPNTLFAIASNTKAFTAMAIAHLVDQGRLDWEDKVTDYLPYFRAYAPYVTENFTISDLMSHHSGLQTFSGDLLWYGTDLTPEQIISASGLLKPAYGFRTHFGYSNIHFLSAGMVIEAITDTTWVDYITEHFLKPLGMNRTLTSTTQLAGVENVATPYYLSNGQNIALEWINWDNIAPAGALISSANDYTQWIKLIINRGKLNGKTFVSDEQFEELTTLHVVNKVSKFSREISPSKHFSGYGMGFELFDYRGYKILGHGGGYDGMISKSCFVPEKKIGFIILTNNLNWLPTALMYKTLDVMLGDEYEGTDWSQLFHDFKTKRDKETEEKEKESEAKRGTLGPAAHPITDYAGTYTDKMYGDVKVWLEDGKLHFKMVHTPIFEAELEHWNLEIFTFHFAPSLSSLPEGKLWFKLDKNGEVTGLKIDVPNPDFYFDEFDFVKQKNEE